MNYAAQSLPIEHNLRGFYQLLGFGNEKNCRYAWVRRQKSKNKWIPLGVNKSGKTALSSPKDVFSSVATTSIETFKNTDFYISPNEFFDWRCQKQLARLHANYIEIDTNNHQVLDDEQAETVCNEVLSQIQNQDIPMPNAIVKSGSGGLHLYWVYEAVEAYAWRQSVWKEFADTVRNKLGNGELWHVDYKATIDPSRLLRLPGSSHSQSKRTVKAYILTPERFSFDELMHSVGINPERPSYLKPIPTKTKKVETTAFKQERVARGKRSKHNIKEWWLKIYWEVVKHARAQGVKKGQRDSAAFILFVSLLHIKPNADEALEDIKSLNNEIIGLDEDELCSYLSTAIKKKYRYRKSTLATYLEQSLSMNTAFLYELAIKVRLTPEQVSERRSIGAKMTAKVKREKTLQRLKSILASTANMTLKQLSKAAGVSLSTVKRYKKLLTEDRVISSVSI
ncbi:hypothetical protein [Pseudoalteromonas luteoviolacea]|uniref:hypothetical protein n=1 Tax=Pseudoalteromonas luteoviolacea TaxID=43657 RepID=UPI001B392297|nr:hypothetical protein [Pseudoalteromonas luteoviolacea]MBQ4839828.1 hypothetical protein [Pseudoalteromonas luteoviolacea]